MADGPISEPPAQGYLERVPVPALAARGVGGLDPGDRAGQRSVRAANLPTGAVELHCRVGDVPKLVGPLTGPRVEELAPGTVLVGLRFRPGAAPAVLGMPASELVDLSVDAGALWGDEALALAERLAAAASPEAALAAVQAAVVARAAAVSGPDPLIAAAVTQLGPWGVGDVGTVTRSLHISERQLRRRCLDAVGLPPKALQRILRFQGFLALAQQALARGAPPAEGGLALLAAEVGYADQPHLTHECVRLTGVPPGSFLGEAEHRCACGHDHSASFAPLLRARRAA